MANMGIEVEIYKDTAVQDKIGVIEARRSPTVLREVRADGAGSFVISKNNPKILADPSLLDYRNFVRIRTNGQVTGGFIIKTKRHVIVGEGEAADEAWSVSGEGLRSWGLDAAVRPPRGLSANSRETRFFNFASERGSWYNPAQWAPATLVNQWGAASAAWRGTAPSEWPDAPNAYWIWDRGPATYQMPQGYVYFRREFSLSEKGQYTLFFAVDDAAEVYIDGDLVHTTAEHAWEETTRLDVDLDVGEHVIALRCYNYQSDGPGSLIAAFYKVGNASSPSAATQLFVSDSQWVVCPYPATAPGWTPGQILNTLLDEAAARGVRFASNWGRTFTNTHDSAGVPWNTSLDISFDVGTNYSEVFEALEEAACDIFLDPDTLQLSAWKERGTDRSIEGNTVDPIILRVGHNLRTANETGQADIVNTLLLKTADGWQEVKPDSTESQTKYGVLEGQISTDLTFSAASKLISEVFKKKSTPEKTATFELIPVPGIVPWENFFEGDYVSAPGEVPGVLEKRRIMSIAVTEDDGNGKLVYAVEFDAIFSSRTDDMAKMLSKTAHSSALGGGFTGTTAGESTVTQGSGPSVPVGSPPAQPSGLVVQTVGRWAENGSAVSDYGLTWNPVVSNINNLPVTDIEKYEVWGRKSTDTNSALLATVFDAYAFLSGFRPGEDWYFKTRAFSRTGGFGAFTAEQHLVANAPVVPMGVPSPPTLITELGTVIIRWDGLIGGSPAPSRFKHMEVQRSTSQSGTYTVVSSFVSGSASDASGVVGTQYWYRLVPVDYLGVKGSPSTAVSITVAGVSTAELDQAVNDAITGAVTASNNAVTAANGKNKITFSNNAPTTSDSGIAGDMWYRRDANGSIIGLWENTGGTTWVSRTMTEGSVADLNAGVLTKGFIAADRVATNSLTSEKVLIANLDNQLDNPNFETNSFLGWLQTGSVAGWSTPASGAANINRYLQRTTTTATAPGQLTNIFKVQTRAGNRLRIDALSYNTGITPGPWTEAQRNHFADPLAQTVGDIFWGVPTLGSLSTNTTFPGFETAARYTRSATGSSVSHRFIVGTSLPRGNVRLRFKVRSSEAMSSVSVMSRPDVNATTNQVTLASGRTIPSGVSDFDVTGPAGSFTATASSGLVLQNSGGTAGATLDIVLVGIESAATAGAAVFTGATSSSSDLLRYRWVGTPNASQSVAETRTAPSTIGVQFFDAAGVSQAYVGKALDSTGTWSPVTWEVDVPDNAYFASLRIVDNGVANSTLRLANLQFRLMGAGQLLVDGVIQGRHVGADTIEGASMKAGSIQTDRLSPNAGASLDIAANSSVNILVGQVASQGETLTSQQQRIDELNSGVGSAQDQAQQAAATANAASQKIGGLQAGIDKTSADLAAMGTTFRFTETGAYIGSPGSPYEFVIQNNGAEIRQNGVATTSWDSGRMIVNSFVGNEVVLANHKLESDDLGTGTVVRKVSAT